MSQESIKIKPEPSFESQIRDVHKVESLGGIARYTYFRHEHPKEGSLPILVASGWSEGSPTLLDTAKAIYEDGREAILVDHARKGGAKKGSTDFHPETVHKSDTLIKIIDDAGLDRVDVIAHSEGAINISLAALEQPERFRNIILVAPAGMIGKDSVPRLIGRFIPKIVVGIAKDLREIEKERAKRIAAAGPEYIVKNPLKSAREIGAIAHSTIDKVLVDVRQAGIKVGLIQSNTDYGYPAHRIEPFVVWDGEESNVDAYASAAGKDAGHDDLFIHPERSTRAALQMIENFEKLEK